MLGAALLSGCASSNYLTDRWNDAKDIGTATVGVGGGAKARVGPVGAGLHWVRDFAGLRGGDVGALQPKTNDASDFGVLLFGDDQARLTPKPESEPASESSESGTE